MVAAPSEQAAKVPDVGLESTREGPAMGKRHEARTAMRRGLVGPSCVGPSYGFTPRRHPSHAIVMPRSGPTPWLDVETTVQV